MASMTAGRPGTTLSDLLPTLTGVERRYAAAYADHLSVGDPEPAVAGFDPAVAADIRRAVLAEWRARLNASPVMSGRVRVERGRRTE